MTLQIGPQQPETLGHAIFSGLGGALQQQGQALGQQQQEQQQREARGRQLYQVLNSEQYKNLPLNDKTIFLSAMFPEAGKAQIEQQKIGQQRVSKAQEIQLKAQEKQEKETKETRESALLAKEAAGETLTQEELSELSPTSLRSRAQVQKPVFEEESAKLSAKRASDLSTEIEADFEAYKIERFRSGRQLKLAEKGTLSTPLMVKALDAFHIPLGSLLNVDTQDYSKVEADYVKDVSKVFTGQIRVFEIQAYLKTIPTLMNSDEGKKRIIANRKILNEAKKIKYDAYEEIMKDRTFPPPDLGIRINEMTREKMAALEDQYINGIREALDKSGPTIPMIGPNGEIADIPVYGIEQSQEQGWKINIE